MEAEPNEGKRSCKLGVAVSSGLAARQSKSSNVHGVAAKSKAKNRAKNGLLNRCLSPVAVMSVI